jgi:hypothetical protein
MDNNQLMVLPPQNKPWHWSQACDFLLFFQDGLDSMHECKKHPTGPTTLSPYSYSLPILVMNSYMVIM